MQRDEAEEGRVEFLHRGRQQRRAVRRRGGRRGRDHVERARRGSAGRRVRRRRVRRGLRGARSGVELRDTCFGVGEVVSELLYTVLLGSHLVASSRRLRSRAI